MSNKELVAELERLPEDGARSTFDLSRAAAGTYTLLLVREERVLYHRFVLR
ncbi:MAG: hypothetical protein IPJ76_12555 [Flavobacteriales bacterium]|nr:MAG: hypothetical protein IPJ76_12555 [Flavobacteriales bacterium]